MHPSTAFSCLCQAGIICFSKLPTVDSLCRVEGIPLYHFANFDRSILVFFWSQHASKIALPGWRHNGFLKNEESDLCTSNFAKVVRLLLSHLPPALCQKGTPTLTPSVLKYSLSSFFKKPLWRHPGRTILHACWLQKKHKYTTIPQNPGWETLFFGD